MTDWWIKPVLVVLMVISVVTTLTSLALAVYGTLEGQRVYLVAVNAITALWSSANLAFAMALYEQATLQEDA